MRVQNFTKLDTALLRDIIRFVCPPCSGSCGLRFSVTKIERTGCWAV